MSYIEELLGGNVPTCFEVSTLESFDRRPNNEAAYRLVESYINDLRTSLAMGRGILLWGPAQEGKTMLVSIILSEVLKGFASLSLVDQQLARRKIGTGNAPGFPGYFLTLADYIRTHLRMFSLEKRWSKLDSIEGSDEYAEYIDIDKYLEALRDRVGLLVVDDVGKEHRTDSHFAADEFDYLLRRRHHHALSTILTSNEDPDRWEMYNSSMPAFVIRNFEVVEIKASRRIRRAG